MRVVIAVALLASIALAHAQQYDVLPGIEFLGRGSFLSLNLLSLPMPKIVLCHFLIAIDEFACGFCVARPFPFVPQSQRPSFRSLTRISSIHSAWSAQSDEFGRYVVKPTFNRKAWIRSPFNNERYSVPDAVEKGGIRLSQAFHDYKQEVRCLFY